MVFFRFSRRTIALFSAAIFVVLSAFVQVTPAQDPTGRPDLPRGRRPVRRPAKVEPITVILTVITEPPESTVLINGEPRGVTDAEGKIQIEKLPLGHYSVEVRKEGFTSTVRGFDAGTESPTLVFRLEPKLDEVAQQFDSLVAAGKLIGPDSPNAFEIADKHSASYPDRPEVVRMRTVLVAKLVERAGEALTRVVSDWRVVERDELVLAQDLVLNALALSKDDHRIQAQAAFIKGALAFRDWQAAGNAGEQVEHSAENGGLTMARGELGRAVGLDGSWAAAHFLLGTVLMNTADSGGATAAFTRALQIEPNWAAAHAGLGSAYYEDRKYKESIDAFRKAVELKQNYAPAYAGLGLARAARGGLKDAVKDLQRAMQLDPTSALPHYYMGVIYSRSNKSKELDQAAQHLEEAIQKNTGNLEFRTRDAERLLAEVQKKRKK